MMSARSLEAQIEQDQLKSKLAKAFHNVDSLCSQRWMLVISVHMFFLLCLYQHIL